MYSFILANSPEQTYLFGPAQLLDVLYVTFLSLLRYLNDTVMMMLLFLSCRCGTSHQCEPSSQEALMRKHGKTLIHVQSTHTCTRRHSHLSLGLTASLSPVHSAAVSAPCPTTHKTCTGRRLLRQSSVFWHVLWWEKSRGRCGGREPPLTYRWRESTLLYIYYKVVNIAVWVFIDKGNSRLVKPCLFFLKMSF